MIKFTHLKTIDSTNRYLADTAEKFDDYKAHLVVANQQTSGKGRNGNSWISETNKSLTLSLSIKIDKSTNISVIPMTVAITLAELLKKHSKQSIKIKWPNDLYIQLDNKEFAKFGGVLIDVNQNIDYRVIIGVGINLNQVDVKNNDYLVGYYKCKLILESLIAEIANSLCDNLLINNLKIDTNKYHYFDLLYGKRVIISDISTEEHQSTKVIKGIAMGINNNGHLLIKDDNQQYQRIINQKRIRLATE